MAGCMIWVFRDLFFNSLAVGDKRFDGGRFQQLVKNVCKSNKPETKTRNREICCVYSQQRTSTVCAPKKKKSIIRGVFKK